MQQEHPKVADGLSDYLGISYYLYTTPHNYLVLGLFLLFSLLYLLEIKMLYATLGLFSFSLVIFSFYENNLAGCGELGLVSLIFLVQFIAYFRSYLNKSVDLNKERIQFPLQLLAAAYTLSALTKLRTSGIDWFTTDAENFAVHVMRYHYSAYVSYGLEWYRIKGEFIANFIVQHLLLVKIVLGGVIVLELAAFVLMRSKKHAFVYGMLILIFHTGVFVTINLFIPSFVVPLLALTVNPLYGFFQLFLTKQKPTYRQDYS
jgi:hypothetical protein